MAKTTTSNKVESKGTGTQYVISGTKNLKRFESFDIDQLLHHLSPLNVINQFYYFKSMIDVHKKVKISHVKLL